MAGHLADLPLRRAWRALRPRAAAGRRSARRRRGPQRDRPVLPGLVKNKENLDAGPRRYDRYGFRVPAVIVSPYARPDYVSSEVFDHTSVLKLVEEEWELPPPTRRGGRPTRARGRPAPPPRPPARPRPAPPPTPARGGRAGEAGGGGGGPKPPGAL